MKLKEGGSDHERPIHRLLPCLIIILSVMQSGFCFASPDLELETMYRHANRHLHEYLDGIPEGDEIHYGFISRDEFIGAGLGLAYQEFDMDKEQPTGYWRIPVTVDGENRVLLRLKSTEDGWQFSGLSGNELAINLGDLERHEAALGQPTKTGRIIRDYTMRCDYVQFNPQQVDALSGYIYPLWSASRLVADPASRTGVMDDQSYDLNLIKELRNSAKNRMDYINSINNINRGQ